VVVTVNAGDFITLAAGVDRHPGVIAFREAELRGEQQWNRLQIALAFADQACNGDLFNRVLEVLQGGVCRLHVIPPGPTS
jgi:hypothetical protein